MAVLSTNQWVTLAAFTTGIIFALAKVPLWSNAEPLTWIMLAALVSYAWRFALLLPVVGIYIAGWFGANLVVAAVVNGGLILLSLLIFGWW